MNLQNIGPDLTEDQKADLEKIRDQLREVAKDKKIAIIGLGAIGHIGGYFEMMDELDFMSLEKRLARPVDNMVINDYSFGEYNNFKIVKGRGHDKLKKKKKKK